MGVDVDVIPDGAQTYADFGLSGKVAIVTGGTDGIGFGIAEALVIAGAKVVVASRRPEMCERAEQALGAGGAECIGVPTDVTDETTIANLFSRTVERFGGVDVLVNCAGGSFSDKFRRARLLELGGNDLVEAFRLNVVGSFLCSSMAYPLMQSRGAGSIINISSVGGETGGASGMFAAYGASKAALNHITRSLASEFAPVIRVNAVLPGLIDTPRTSASRTPERLAAGLRGIALGRIGRPDDVAGAVLFLASPLSSWITGALWRVDGGGGLVAGTGQ
jgi:NAD(P)-dependent dehydrogenase (short-subunit alcohol dehydrogenase family)